MARQLSRIAAIASWAAVYLLVACGTPVESTLTIPLSDVFPMGVPKNKVDESFTFFAGTTVDRFSVTLTSTGLTATMKLEARPGDGGTPLATFTSGGTITADFPGNVGVLRFVSDGLDVPPGLTLNAISMHNPGTPAFPAVTSALTGRVTSMPLTLNRPVELAFPPAGTPKTYFLAAAGVAGKTIDIVLDGPGRVLFSTDAATGFVSPEGGATGEPGGFTTTTGTATTITLPPGSGTLFLTVDTAGVAGHARISVNEPTKLLALRARFMSPTAITAGQVAAVTTSLTAANTILYQVTMGRVRIGSLTMLSRLSSSDGNSATPDLVIVPPAGGLIPPVPLPSGAIVFDLSSTGPPSGGGLAVSILNAVLRVPLEPADPNGVVTCPNSFMAPPGAGTALPALCWRGNHNPFGSSVLGAAVPSAAWDTLASRIGLAAPPSASPVHVLRTVTTVTFPFTTTVVP